MEVIFVLLMFLLLIRLSFNDISGNQIWSKLLDRKGITLLLIFWAVSGFILRIHFSTFTYLYSGPEAVCEPLLGFKNVAMAAIPIALYLGSYLLKDKEQSLVLVILEIGFWLFVLFCAKGNYSWGWEPSPYYFMYDYIALILRFLLLFKFVGVREHRFSGAWLLAHVMISCKVGFFSNSCFG